MKALDVVALIVAAEHLWFLALEMFPVDEADRAERPSARQPSTPSSPPRWRRTRASTTASWPRACSGAPSIPTSLVGRQIQLFFLACVAAAGIMGALTVSKRILYIQALPAFVGLALGFWRG